MSEVLSNPLSIAGLIAAGGLLLVLLWVITILLRLIFSREQSFPMWQPPYLVPPVINPNTLPGRRLLWQGQTSSDALPLSMRWGEYAARKRLTSIEGKPLGRWTLTDVRLMQYDVYGRIARTQVMISNRLVRRLRTLIAKQSRKPNTPEKLRRSLKPIVEKMLQRSRRASRRTPTLPLAIDLRFRGTHGEVRVVFELLQSVSNGWELVDRWEPELQFLKSRVVENYTYTLAGQQVSEPTRAFHQRQQDDLTYMLASMLQPVMPIAPPPPPPSAESIADTAPMPVLVLPKSFPPESDTVRLSSDATTPIPTVSDETAPTPPSR